MGVTQGLCPLRGAEGFQSEPAALGLDVLGTLGLILSLCNCVQQCEALICKENVSIFKGGAEDCDLNGALL